MAKYLRIQYVVILFLLVPFSSAGAFAQQPVDVTKPPEAAAAAPIPAFDVVSVKEYKWGGGSYFATMRWDDNGVTAMNVNLSSLICMAYGVDYYKVSGVPEWAALSLYQLQARMDDSTVEALKKLPKKDADDLRERMLQAVLADRFKLKVRRETRLLPNYALVVAKGGSKLKEAAPEDPHTDKAPNTLGSRGNLGMRSEDGALVIYGQAISLDALAGQVGGTVNAKVMNESGLKGVYDIKLRFAPDTGPAETSEVSAPSIFVALQEQLGLKLESRKEPEEALIVEHAEKPSEN
jgi:uncharacterized protein (TIGR03435 family)